MTSATIPDVIATQADATKVESAARRVETPCGDGVVVWHVWGDGDPLLLLHGGSGSWNHWVRNIGALVAAGRMVCVPDLPGFGDSAAPPTGDDADALPEWIERGLQAIVGAAACDVVGFSFGSMVATFIAATWPQRARRLVLVGAPALSSAPRPLGLRPWEHLTDADERRAAHRYNLARLMLARESAIDELAIELHAANLERDRLRKRRISQTDIVLRTLPRIRCLVAGIWGADDVLYRDRREIIAPALAQAPDFRSLVLIPGAGHWVQYEQPQAFNETLGAMLELPVSPPGA